MKILDVGQCGFDGPRMKALLSEQLDASVVNAVTADDARRKIKAGGFDIVLVNRIFAADGSEGIDLIESIASEPGAPPLMLVSDHPDAQEAAVAKGAVRGFGKADLEKPETMELIRDAAGKKN